jgi:hypothetical protein
MMSTLDTTPLTAPVAASEVAAFRTAMRDRPEYAAASPLAQFVVAIIALVVMVFVVGSFVSLAVGVIGTSLQDVGLPGLIFLGFPLVVLAVIIIVAVTLIRRHFRGGGRWERWMRLDRFAAANGLTFSPLSRDPHYPGMIFGQGRSRAALDHVRSSEGRFLDYGTYRYVTGSGKNSTTHTWGFLALELDRSLPHMVLDAKANNGLFGSTIGIAFSKDQILSLEGDFNEHFTLYCPREYERDALYVFTPDLMALAIDEAAAFDIEIVDKWMFVYSTRGLDLLDPRLQERMHRIISTVGAKTVSQTDRYRDDRVPSFEANVVAPSGQRLRRGVSVGAIAVVAVFLVMWSWPWISGLFGTLLGR